jgi:uncharacterized protein (DUF1501 family)
MSGTPMSRIDRREMLASCGAAAGLALLSSRAQGAVRVLASPALAPQGAARTLILLQLSGGNDGLDTVVPYADDVYQRLRPTLARKKSETLPIDEYRGLHAGLPKLRKLLDAGRLAIVEGVGYPDPIRSHFQALDVWHTADHRGRDAGEGWIGKLCDAAFADNADPNLVVHIGANVPYSLHSTTHPPAAFVLPQSYRWAGDPSATAAYEKAGAGEDGGGGGEGKDEKPKKREGESSLEFVRRVLADGQSSSQQVRRAVARYATSVDYPRDALGAALRDVAALLEGRVGTRVFSVELSGFDTHTDERGRHENLLKQLDAALGAFVEDLGRSEAGRNAVVLVFSEFGRRVAENGARGTDHGVAAPVFVLGHQVRGGLHGKHPSLERLDEGDLVHTTDFRSIYAAVVRRCFAIAPEKVLGARFEPVAIL